MRRGAGAVGVAAVLLSSWSPARGGDAGTPGKTTAAIPVGQVVLRTKDPWLRWLALGGDTLYFVQDESVRYADDQFKGDGIFGVAVNGPAAGSARRFVAADLPDHDAWARMLAAQEEREKLGAPPEPAREEGEVVTITGDSPDRFWVFSAGGRLYWKEYGDLKAMTLPAGPVETIGRSDGYAVLADKVVWMQGRALWRRPAAGGEARVLLRAVRGVFTREGEDALVIAQADGKRTRLIDYQARTDATRTIGSVPFAATPVAVDDGHVYLDAGRRLVSYETATATTTELARVPGKLRSAVLVGAFIVWEARDGRKLWRRRVDGGDQPTVIAESFNIDVVCGGQVFQGDAHGEIRALDVARGTTSIIARSPDENPVRYLFRAPHDLFWQTNGTIYRVPFECEGRNPLPPRGMAPSNAAWMIVKEL